MAGVAVSSGMVLAGCTSSDVDDAVSNGSELMSEVQERVKEQYGSIRSVLDEGYEYVGPKDNENGYRYINFDLIEKASEEGFDEKEPQIVTFDDSGDGYDILSIGYIAYEDDIDDLELELNEDSEWETIESGVNVYGLPDDAEDDVDLSKEIKRRHDDGNWVLLQEDIEESEGDVVNLKWDDTTAHEGHDDEESDTTDESDDESTDEPVYEDRVIRKKFSYPNLSVFYVRLDDV